MISGSGPGGGSGLNSGPIVPARPEGVGPSRRYELSDTTTGVESWKDDNHHDGRANIGSQQQESWASKNAIINHNSNNSKRKRELIPDFTDSEGEGDRRDKAVERRFAAYDEDRRRSHQNRPGSTGGGGDGRRSSRQKDVDEEIGQLMDQDEDDQGRGRGGDERSFGDRNGMSVERYRPGSGESRGDSVPEEVAGEVSACLRDPSRYRLVH